MGWCRVASYYRHRVFRNGDSIYRITAGLASGVAVSWNPLFGTHLLQAMLLTWIVRANHVAGLLGTAFGNPWTFPFIIFIAYKVGSWLMVIAGFDAPEPALTWAYAFSQPARMMADVMTSPKQYLLSLLLGGFVCAAMSWPVAYAVFYYPVKIMHGTYNRQRRSRRLKALQARLTLRAKAPEKEAS